MNIEQKIEEMYLSDHQKAYMILKELLTISEASDQVYPYFDMFIEMMNHKTNSYIRTRGLKLIAYNAKWDREHKVDNIIHEWLQHMEDEKPITARQCIKDSVIIAKSKPELIDTIIEALQHVDHIYADSIQPLIYKDRQRAIRQVKQYTW